MHYLQEYIITCKDIVYNSKQILSIVCVRESVFNNLQTIFNTLFTGVYNYLERYSILCKQILSIVCVRENVFNNLQEI